MIQTISEIILDLLSFFILIIRLFIPCNFKFNLNWFLANYCIFPILL